MIDTGLVNLSKDGKVMSRMRLDDDAIQWYIENGWTVNRIYAPDPELEDDDDDGKTSGDYKRKDRRRGTSDVWGVLYNICLLYTSPSTRDS